MLGLDASQSFISGASVDIVSVTDPKDSLLVHSEVFLPGWYVRIHFHKEGENDRRRI